MFSFLEEYKLREDLFEGNGVEKVMKYTHHFYTPYPEDIPKALETFNPFPVELKAFYEQIGFGFMHRRKGKLNRVLDPVSLILVNLRQDECRYDKALERTLAHYDTDRQLLFFQSDKGEYIAIDRTETNGSNPVFYKHHKLTDSLHEFIAGFHKNESWLESIN
ncbi:antitoxin YxxD [Bacteroidia bacterium]|nr:antitoxin YxxD [Bacteroidia bacterium]GHU84825.1 antitoxin YxxD [Bacteroidia bacterium]